MLTMRMKRFIRRTGRNNFDAKRGDLAGFDKSKVRCYTCNDLGHFSRECPKHQANPGAQQQPSRFNRGNNSRPSQALVSQEGMGFDWSDQAEEATQNHALMAKITEPGLPQEVSSKLCSDECTETVKKYRDHNQTMSDTIKSMEVDRREYRIIIENLESQIKAYKENELQFEYDYNYWKWEKKEYEKKLSKASEDLESVQKELDQSKADLDKFSKSSKALEEILKAQIHDELKRGIGYHNTPPPYNNTYIPPTTDLLDHMNREDIKSDVCKVDPVSVKEVIEKECKTQSQETIPEENHILTNEKGGMPFIPSKKVEKSRKGKEKVDDQEPRRQSTHRTAVDPGTSTQFQNNERVRGNKRNWNNQWAQNHGVDLKKINKPKPCFICCKLNHLAKDCYYNPINQRVQFQNQRYFPKQFMTKQNENNKRFVPKPDVKKPKFQKGSSQSKGNNQKKRTQKKKVEKNHSLKIVAKWVPKLAKDSSSTDSSVTTADTTASSNSTASSSNSKSESVNAITDLKKRDPIVGNPDKNENLWHVDSGCSRHMTGNMSYLEDFFRFNGGYVAFGDNPKGGKISGKGKVTGAVAAVGRRWRRWLFEFDAATPPIVVVAVDGGCFHESRSSGDGGGCGRCCRRVRGDGGGCGCCCRRTHGGGGGVKRLPSLVVWRWWRRGFNFTGISGGDGGNRCCRRRDRDRQPRRRSTAAGWWRRLLPVVLDWAAMVTFVVVLAGGNKPLFNGHD
ncbi:hypothetical protein OSB04_027764 [Centaurea solstitialis]|uniref:CCHC-type domain-containing protein n=1 Tax=Centaurea solstitialis TaxID=347529 RepID=A0AA38SF84_9ASTR|nr:hypothetical protein OSB04_027764 [Centaurea solstitialis]